MSYQEALGEIKRLAKGLVEAGVKRGDRLVIMAPNSPRWALADLAILSLGAISVPIYPSETAAAAEKILTQTEALGAFYEGEEQLEKLRQQKGRDQKLHFLIDLRYGPEPAGGYATEPAVHSYESLLTRFAVDADFDPYFAEVERCNPEDPATIIYTSGTSGEPKGVVLTHGQILHNLEAAMQVLPLHRGERFLSFLPLSHSFERTCGFFGPLYIAGEIFFTPSVQEIESSLREVRPTVMIGVPRSCEKLLARIEEKARHTSGLWRGLFRRYLAAELFAQFGRRSPGQPYNFTTPFYRWLGRRFFQPKISQALGGQLRLMVIGGAALPQATAQVLNALGLCILPGYGLTEAGPVVSVNPPQANRLATVGPPLPGIETRISPEGELWIRGPSVMSGYFHNPEETRQAITDEGWLRTGDLASLDSQGYISITGRIKDLIVTSGGKNVAPQAIEEGLLADRLVEQACVLGDGRPHLVCLLVPNRQVLLDWATQRQLGTLAYEKLLQHPEVEERFQQLIDKNNRFFPPYARVRKLILLDRLFSQENGELTPTLKIKRRVIEEKRRDLLDQLYSNG